MIMKFIDTVVYPVSEHYVEYEGKKSKMELMSRKNIGLKLLYSCYATDVTFEQILRHSGRVL